MCFKSITLRLQLTLLNPLQYSHRDTSLYCDTFVYLNRIEDSPDTFPLEIAAILRSAILKASQEGYVSRMSAFSHSEPLRCLSHGVGCLGGDAAWGDTASYVRFFLASFKVPVDL